MSTSAGHRTSCSNDNASKNRPSSKDACSTSNKPPNIDPTDEPNPPLIHFTICLKSFDDGQKLLPRGSGKDAGRWYLIRLLMPLSPRLVHAAHIPPGCNRSLGHLIQITD